MSKKLSTKQLAFLVSLANQQGKEITENYMTWLENLPATEASMLIDKWVDKAKRRKDHWKRYVGS